MISVPFSHAITRVINNITIIGRQYQPCFHGIPTVFHGLEWKPSLMTKEAYSKSYLSFARITLNNVHQFNRPEKYACKRQVVLKGRMRSTLLESK
jgi:hypothetical protein